MLTPHPLTRRTIRPSYGQNDFTDLLACIHHRVRIASLCERERGMHDRTDPAGFEQRPHLGLERLRNLGLEGDRSRPILCSWRVLSAGRGGFRVGQSIVQMPIARSMKVVAPTAAEPRLLCTIVIGMSPAGFIMNMIMKTAMIAISMTIIRIVTTPT